MSRRLIIVLVLCLFGLTIYAQEGSVFVNEGETVVYYLSRDPQGQKGTVSDALQKRRIYCKARYCLFMHLPQHQHFVLTT